MEVLRIYLWLSYFSAVFSKIVLIWLRWRFGISFHCRWCRQTFRGQYIFHPSLDLRLSCKTNLWILRWSLRYPKSFWISWRNLKPNRSLKRRENHFFVFYLIQMNWNVELFCVYQIRCRWRCLRSVCPGYWVGWLEYLYPLNKIAQHILLYYCCFR